MNAWNRRALLIVESFVALTAFAGGAVLLIGTVASLPMAGLVPKLSYLHGSPFHSYAIPGFLLAVVVGGSQALAAVLLARRAGSAVLGAVIAAMGLSIWIFVELIFIPFSLLQAVYFVLALAEFGLAFLGLGLLRRSPADNGTLDPSVADAPSGPYLP